MASVIVLAAMIMHGSTMIVRSHVFTSRAFQRPNWYEHATTISPSDSTLTAPSVISVNENGRLQILEANTYRIVTLQSDGGFVSERFDPEPFEPDERQNYDTEFPMDVVALNGDESIVLRGLAPMLWDSSEPGRQYFRMNQDGSLSDVIYGHNEYPHGLFPSREWMSRIAVDEDAQLLYTLDQGFPAIVVNDLSNGSFLGYEALPPARREARVAEYDWYVDIDTLRDGRLVILNQANSEVIIQRSRWGPSAPSRDFKVEGQPVRVATYQDLVYVLDESGDVKVLTVEGAHVTQFDARGLSQQGGEFVTDIDVSDGGIVYATIGNTGAINVFQPSAVRPSRSVTRPSCELDVSKEALPTSLVLGDSTSVSLSVSGHCPSRSGTDLVIGIERDVGTGGFSRNTLPRTKETVSAILSNVDLSNNRIGLMSNEYVYDIRREHPLSSDRVSLMRALNQIEAVDAPVAGVSFQRYFARAESILNGEGARDDAQKIVMMFATFSYPGLIAPDRIRSHATGTRVIGVSALSELDLRRLSNYSVFHHSDAKFFPLWIASGYWDHYAAGELDARNLDQLSTRLQLESETFSASELASTIVVTDVVPSNMLLDEHSISPPADWNQDSRVLKWILSDVPFSGVELTYTVRPTEAGEWPTNEVAHAGYVDGLGITGEVYFPVPRVFVHVPTDSPTNTSTATVPLPTYTPSDVPGPSSTPRPSVTIGSLYLPVTLGEEPCNSHQHRIAVALALDASTSMLQLTSAGRTKLDAARGAAEIFLDHMQFESGDEAAIVAFSADATVIMKITSDREALQSSLTRIEVEPNTCLVCGIEASLREVDRHAPGLLPVVIVLTDGKSNPRPAREAVEAARRAKSQGVVFFTIGLGLDVESEALLDIASRKQFAYMAPDAEELAEIYSSIAIDIPCPASAFWPFISPP